MIYSMKQTSIHHFVYFWKYHRCKHQFTLEFSRQYCPGLNDHFQFGEFVGALSRTYAIKLYIHLYLCWLLYWKAKHLLSLLILNNNWWDGNANKITQCNCCGGLVCGFCKCQLKYMPYKLVHTYFHIIVTLHYNR